MIQECLPPTADATISFGTRIMDFVSAVKDPGYRPEQVSKILVTHTHRDPTGELSSFPSAKIFNAQEDADALNLKGDSSIRVSYKDDAFRMAVFLLDKHH